MKSHVQAAVIGGGVVGASVLYHLAKLGWREVALFERSELTAGSTWHAAGGMHTLNADPYVAKLQAYTINLYRTLEQESGQSCGVHQTGGIMLASDPDRLDYIRAAYAKGKVLGLDLELLDPAEVKRRLPIADVSDVLGGLYDPLDGHVDPSGVTNAYAKAARSFGAEVYRHTPVEELTQNPDGSWNVVTPKGTVVAEHIVNCGGLWAREVGALVGHSVPILPMEHQYILTDEIPEVADSPTEIIHAMDFKGESYMRQEGKGLLLGTYEAHGTPWSLDGTPKDFGHELLPSDLDRIIDRMEAAYRRYPCLAEAGIKKIVNGPFSFAGDGNPLLGPVPGYRNYWIAAGVMAGFSQGGGVGLSLAQWMIDGEPETSTLAMDVARYGDFANKRFTLLKVKENYGRRFSITFPNEELPAARPLRTTPVYSRLKQLGAVMGAQFGTEYPLWFAPDGMAPVETASFRRSNAFGPVAEECRAVRERAGILEVSVYGKHEIEGPGAAAFLDRVFANRLPAAGRIALTPMLSAKGRIVGDLTVARLAEDRFFVIGSGSAELYHQRWFHRHLPAEGVRCRAVTREWVGFNLAGPEARRVLQKLTDEDLGGNAFPFLAMRELALGLVPALVGRISFTGELGYEIYVRPEHQNALLEQLLEAGREVDARLVGARALQSLRVEKGFGGWTREYTPANLPFEAGLGRFVKLDKGDFVGREAAAAEKAAGPKRRLVVLEVAAREADLWGDEPLLDDGRCVGYVTSGAYGHTVGKSLALGYLPSELAEPGRRFVTDSLGDRLDAVVLPEPPYDPSGERMRA